MIAGQRRWSRGCELPRLRAMKDYIAPKWLATLQRNRVAGFAELWDLEADWFEDPNQRRGGWSGVSRCQFRLAAGGSAGFFLKRQENHVHRTLLHPWRGVPTLVREMRNLARYQAAGVPTLVPVYFAQRRIEGRMRALLLTEELLAYRSLSDWMRDWRRAGWPPREERTMILSALAELLRRMHRHHLQHNCCYPKHLFLRRDDAAWQACIIDLEKTKRTLRRNSARIRDLSTLHRHAPYWSRSDRLRFFLAYLGLDRLDARAKGLARKVLRDAARKLPQPSRGAPRAAG